MQSVEPIEKPLLDITKPLDQLVDASEKFLSLQPTIYQKSGELISVDRDIHGKLVLKPLKSSLVRYWLSKIAYWANEEKRVHPPTSVAKVLMDKHGWADIKPLRALATFPPMGPNGSLNTKEGYHKDTHVFFTGDVKVNIPERPTQQDAKKAVATLMDIVCDFPFAEEAHKSAWLAGLLSPLSRFAHDGNMPMVIIQANSPRAGKTSLARIISYILTGEETPVVTYTKNEDETRKRILSYLKMGRSMVLVDNVVGEFGGAAINAMATSRHWEDRVLGSSRVIQVQNDTTWLITGNNIQLAPDTPERCLNIRLYIADEKPHLRGGFKYPDLWDVVKQRRSELLSAALTILKGYILAGQPDMKIPKWGSFEAWSKMVRGAIVWAGMPDPAITRAELESNSDGGREAATAFVEGWWALQQEVGSKDGMTAAEAVNHLRNGADATQLRMALDEMTGGVGKLPNAHTIGRHLREYRDRTYGGKAIKCIPNPKLGHKWFVSQITQKGTGGQGVQDKGRNSSGERAPGMLHA